MAPFPEQGTPEYDERIEQVRQRLRNGPRLRFRILVWAGIVVTMVLPGIYFLVRSFCSDALLGERLGGALFGTIFLLLPGRILFVTLRRHRQTGIWSLKATPEERLKGRSTWINRTPAQKKRFSFILASTDFVILACGLIALAVFFKPHHVPHDLGDYIYVVIWTLVGATSTRTIYRQYIKKPRTTA